MLNTIKAPPVLVLGCGRSGTSIFGELFQDLGSHRYLSEPNFADYLSLVSDNIAAKVPTEDPGYPADPGLSFPMDTLLARAPNLKVFWIVRHPFDAIASLRVGIGDGWKHHPRPPDWQDSISRPLIEQCAYHWSYINTLGYQSVGDLATLVRFEDMITDPYRFATEVLTVLDLDTAMFHNNTLAWSERVQNSNNAKFVEAQTSRGHSRSDHSVRIGRWRENLSEEDLTIVRHMVADANERFGYDLSG